MGELRKNQFQRELQDPRIERAADDAEAGAIDRCAGRAQIRNCSRFRSVIWKFLKIPRSPQPRRAVPIVPTVLAANTLVLNQCAI